MLIILFLHTVFTHFKAYEYYKRTLKLTQKVGDIRVEGGALTGIGEVFILKGEHKKGIHYLTKAKSLLESKGITKILNVVYQSLTTGYLSLNVIDSARFYSEKATLGAEEIDDLFEFNI